MNFEVYTRVVLLYNKLVNGFLSDYVESSDALTLQILSFQLQINSLKSKTRIEVWQESLTLH